MCFELENEIGCVDAKEEYRSAARDDQKALLSLFVEIRDQPIAHCAREVPLAQGIAVFRGVIGGRNHKSCSLS